MTSNDNNNLTFNFNTERPETPRKMPGDCSSIVALGKSTDDAKSLAVNPHPPCSYRVFCL